MTFLFDIMRNGAHYGEYTTYFPEFLARTTTPEKARERMHEFAVEEVKGVKEARLVLRESRGDQGGLTGTLAARARILLERDFVVVYEAAVARGVSNHNPDA